MNRFLGKLAESFALVGGAAVILIVLVTTVNAGAFILDRMSAVLGRDIPGLPGYEDFVRLTISAAALMFLPYCQLKRGHVAVDLFMARVPRAIRRVIDRAWLLVTAAIALFLAWWMIQGLAENFSDGVVTGVLGWPEWPFYVPGIVSLLLWAAVALGQTTQEDAHV